MKKIRLTKISDNHFEGKHPNGINEGYTKEGYEIEKPTLDRRFYVGGSNFSTSVVIEELNKEGLFKTLYSTYKLEYLDEE